MPYDINVLPTTLSLNELNFITGSLSSPLNGEYNFERTLTGIGGSSYENRYTNSTGEQINIRFASNGSMSLTTITTNASWIQASPGGMDHPVQVEVTYTSTNRDFNNLIVSSGRFIDI
jgi:hypothetical protein